MAKMNEKRLILTISGVAGFLTLSALGGVYYATDLITETEAEISQTETAVRKDTAVFVPRLNRRCTVKKIDRAREMLTIEVGRNACSRPRHSPSTLGAGTGMSVLVSAMGNAECFRMTWPGSSMRSSVPKPK